MARLNPPDMPSIRSKNLRVGKTAFCFGFIRWCHGRTNARIPRGNTAHETNRISREHIELIGLLYYDKSHVSCGGVCKEWGFTPLPQEAKTTGKVNLAKR